MSISEMLERGILCLICFLIFYLILLVNQIRIYFIEKEKMIKSKKLLNIQETTNSTKEPIIEMVESSATLLTMIDKIISLEVDKKVAYLKFENKNYNMLSLDKDVKILGNKIFSSVKKEVLTDNELILTSDYLMEYIVSECTLLFTAKVKEFNIAIRTQEIANQQE